MTLVGADEAEADAGRISWHSPLARALKGASVGDVRRVELPGNALRLCGLALEAAVDPDLDRPLSRRFLDAAAWFGEAVREESPAARVVKYVTALERMLMTDEADDITRLVNRAVAHCRVMFASEGGEATPI